MIYKNPPDWKWTEIIKIKGINMRDEKKMDDFERIDPVLKRIESAIEEIGQEKRISTENIQKYAWVPTRDEIINAYLALIRVMIML